MLLSPDDFELIADSAELTDVPSRMAFFLMSVEGASIPAIAATLEITAEQAQASLTEAQEAIRAQYPDAEYLSLGQLVETLRQRPVAQAA